MPTEKIYPTLLKNYAKPDFAIEKTDLIFDLYEEYTLVTSMLYIVNNHQNNDNLILQGEELELISIKRDGHLLSSDHYKVLPEGLEITNMPTSCTLEIKNRIHPLANTQLSGLYKSSGHFCTQCEPEGFRRITYYLDRPDVLSLFTTTIIADKVLYPHLLSNGNRVEQGEIDTYRHWVKWHDPFKKPSYLFALVAGNFAVTEDYFYTCSNKKVCLQIYADKENRDQCDYAMHALKKAMRWDEQRFGREYDLDNYMIVAIQDFNMGAMENKGLNIFNSKYVLVDNETATDRDFMLVDAVIGHEYFHNWSGNRVTCRDWFQLSLKEGLTIFREHEFISDITCASVKRIEDVKVLRQEQFPQDAGPIAHPVMPDSYIEINNFYTLTIYEKGAEVIRMIQTFIGKKGFEKGLTLYFNRHDGQAATIQDFVKAMEDANQKDLQQFRLWYTQSGTPIVNINTEYDSQNKIYKLWIQQSCSATPNQAVKKPFCIPIVIGLLNSKGNVLDFSLDVASSPVVSQTTLELTQASQSFYLYNVKEKPIPSLLRGFSAPIKLNYPYTNHELRLLMLHDSDGFNRWEARQLLLLNTFKKLLECYQPDSPLTVTEDLKKDVQDFKEILLQDKKNYLFHCELLTFPSLKYFAEFIEIIDMQAIYRVHEFMMKTIADTLREELLNSYYSGIKEQDTEWAEHTIEAIGKRAFKNMCLSYLAKCNDQAAYQLLWHQFESAKNMTDRFAALSQLSHLNCKERIIALEMFFNMYSTNPLVMDKWFAIQAMSTLPDTIDVVKKLLQHPLFIWTNPNRVRAVVSYFASQNPVRFHDEEGRGYQFLADTVLHMDKINSQIAARLVEPLTQWQKQISFQQQMMRNQLERIAKTKDLSKDCYEIVGKSIH